MTLLCVRILGVAVARVRRAPASLVTPALFEMKTAPFKAFGKHVYTVQRTKLCRCEVSYESAEPAHRIICREFRAAEFCMLHCTSSHFVNREISLSICSFVVDHQLEHPRGPHSTGSAGTHTHRIYTSLCSGASEAGRSRCAMGIVPAASGAGAAKALSHSGGYELEAGVEAAPHSRAKRAAAGGAGADKKRRGRIWRGAS
ncbi:hypothetical protein EVAR_9006_1 [Eumeta japonica]|uniref:Uncharacterized protein n=1 Tax=Eumeta variegata TaxID=151549 RepID=A0A4C1WSD5_EUMVA|nr:hypothetical protein EVAR_9006_1 [Eumeta japonica]